MSSQKATLTYSNPGPAGKSAIKFGDYLSQSSCSFLLNSLSKCKFPFQCAHGRPTISPIGYLPSASNSSLEKNPTFLYQHIQMDGIYTLKTAVKPGTCFVCNKESQNVLTNGAGDWFYVCISHTSDRSFCRPEKVSLPAPSKPNPEKVEPKSDAASKETDSKPAEKTPDAPTPLKESNQFTLTSNFVYLRQNYHKKREQAKSAKAISSQLPSVPRRSGF
ncbi:DNA mismatch repair protein [Batrachochytrium dendrobatidis]|nr:DNA mismatch repair protein [Batrachochytrium dendrobatidis]